MQADLSLQRKTGFISAPQRLPGLRVAPWRKSPRQAAQSLSAATGIQAAMTKRAGDRLAPFCYTGQSQTAGDSWLERQSSKRQPITAAPLHTPVRATHTQPQVSLARHNGIQIWLEQSYHSSGVLRTKPGSRNLQRFLSPCSK